MVSFTRLRAHLVALAILRRARKVPGANLFLTSELDQPASIGWNILIPRAASAWDAARLRCVLLHERAHVQRADWLAQTLSDLTSAIYRFHPLSWLSARQALLLRERACDDAVLRQGISEVSYATTLLEVAREYGRNRLSAVSLMAGRPQLDQRIRAIINPTVPRNSTRLALILIAIAAAVGTPLLASVTPQRVLVPRPAEGEPDLKGDRHASPFSERIGGFHVIPPVDPTGSDATLIATLREVATRSPRSPIDFTPERARWALSRVQPGGELVPALIDSLSDADWRVRAYAAWTLAIARDTRAVRPLIGLLDEPLWRVRAMAAMALAKIGDPAARGPMFEALSDPAWQVRMHAVESLGADDLAIIDQMRQDRHMAVRSAAESVWAEQVAVPSNHR